MDREKGSRGKLLIVTYYWPPSAGAGVQRWLKMVKYLVRQGYECTVFTPSNARYAQTDPSLLADVPAGVEVIGCPIVDPSSWGGEGKNSRVGVGLLREEGRSSLKEKLVLWLRANLFVPDAKMLWIRPASRAITEYLKAYPHDALITTGPPHSVHMVGLRVKNRVGIKWLADFRDPWLNIDYMHHLPLMGIVRNLHARWERRVLRRADIVTVVSRGMQEEYLSIRGRAVEVVPNGYDADDFREVGDVCPDSPFTLLHLGSLNADRNPRTLWEAMEELGRAARITPKTFRVALVGPVDATIRAEVARRGLEAYVEFGASISHSAVPTRLRRAGALLLSINDSPNSRGILTGKLFEYLAAERPIVCLGPEDGDAARLIAETGAGESFARDSTGEFAEYLLHLLGQYAVGEYRPKSVGVENYSREAEACRIAELLCLG